MLNGRIININSNKYRVVCDNKKYDAVAKGAFRNKKLTPLVGDYVLFDEITNRIDDIKPRKNSMVRPNIANVDMAIIMVSVKKPDLDLVLLDKLIINIVSSNIEPVICFSKTDLLNSEELNNINKLYNYYESVGYKVFFNTEKDKFEKIASGKVIVLCGQTGSGKSSFLNFIDKNLNLETKPISEALGRGVHTTRYVSLYSINDYFIADTPGFSALDLMLMTKDDIKNGFPEFRKYPCKYRDCDHINTDGCNICDNKNVLSSRYENYIKLLKEQNESSSKLFK